MKSRIQQVIEGEERAFCIGQTSLPEACCILPGSFNPLHQAHREMARWSSERYGLPIEFELSITNVDKSTLTSEQVSERLRQFDKDCVWVTRARTFAEKAQLFPNCTFVIGADTAVRLFDQKYYANAADLDAATAAISDRHCRFLVFGRIVGNHFLDATTELVIPPRIASLFQLVPAVSFRMDLSSSELRRKTKRKGS